MANIVLLDDKGIARTYEGVNTATFNTDTGGLVTFTAPVEHNDTWDVLNTFIKDFPDDYTLYTKDTKYGTYVTSNMFDFGIWLIVGNNAYHILETGAFTTILELNSFIVFRHYEETSIFWHRGDITTAPQSISSSVYTWSTGVKGNTQTVACDVLYSTQGSAGFIVFLESMPTPIYVSTYSGKSSIHVSFSSIAQLREDCFIVYSSDSSDYNGAPVLIFTNGTVKLLPVLSSASGNQRLAGASYIKISDNMVLFGSRSTTTLNAMLNIDAGTWSLVSETVLGQPFTYRVGTSTAYYLSSTWDINAVNVLTLDVTLCGTVSTNQYDILLDSNNTVILGGTSYDSPHVYTGTSRPIDMYGRSDAGFSILNTATNSVEVVCTSGYYDQYSVNYADGLLAILVSNYAGHSDRHNYIYAINTAECAYNILEAGGTQIKVMSECQTYQKTESVSSSSTRYTRHTVPLCAFFDTPNSVYMHFYACGVAPAGMSNTAVCSTVWRFSLGDTELTPIFTAGNDSANLCAKTIGGSNSVFDEYLANETLTIQSDALYTGYEKQGIARIYSNKGTSYSAKSHKALLVVPGHDPIELSFNSSIAYCQILPVPTPIYNNVYACVTGQGYVFFLDLDNLEQPVIDMFYKTTASGISTTRSSARLRYGAYSSLTANVLPWASAVETTEETIILIGNYYATALFSSDLTVCFGIAFNSSDDRRDTNFLDAYSFVNSTVMACSGNLYDTQDRILNVKNAFGIVLSIYNNAVGYKGINSGYPLLYITQTDTGFLYSNIKERVVSGNSLRKTAIVFFPNTSTTNGYTTVYDKGYNWTECHTGNFVNSLQIIRPGYPGKQYLLWHEDTQTISEHTISE